MAQLRRLGAITAWEFPARTGGHTRFALPTQAALQTYLSRLEAETSHEPFAPLVQLMLPGTAKRALHLAVGTTPHWLAHQVEVNALVLRMRDTVPLRWLSTWDCPFPRRITSFDLPQPDYVLIEQRADGPRLVFGEHDRGSEPIERFIERKVLLYTGLAAFPDACRQHFGLPRFTVRVTVTDPVRRMPMVRLMDLLRGTAQAAGPGAAGVFRFSLAGWLHAYPNEAIWFAPHDPPSHTRVKWQDHTARHAQGD